MIDLKKLIKIINSNHSFLLTTHVNPDADAIGSEIAFYRILKSLNKNVVIYNHSETPYNLKFLDKKSIIKKYNPEIDKRVFQNIDVIAALDLNRIDRIVSMKEAFKASDKKKICIDHHPDPDSSFDELFIDTNLSATGEIFYTLIKEKKLAKLTRNIAYPIYTAIMTDTGSFRFEKTTPKLHRIVSDLLETGIDPGEVYDKVYDQSKYSKIKLLGKALNSLTLIADNKIAYMVLTKADFKEVGGLESDTDGFVNHSLSIENVSLGLLFIELNDGFKVSFRSKGSLPVNKLAGKFGGGGHRNAAGARLHNSELQEYLPVILKHAEEFIK